MKNLKYSACAVALMLTFAPAVFAGDMGHEDHHGMQGMASMNGQNDMPKNAFENVMMTMHKSMSDVKPTGDVDIDFIQGMIPHHQGAIDMAKIELAKGKDPQAIAMAKEIIKAQEKEIATMQKWLTEHKY
jgi:uncharacterized protein (DUF305 family)